MTDELGLRRDINRAAHAKALIEDPLLIEAFDTLRDAYRKVWEESRPIDALTREKAFLALRMLPVLRQAFETVIMDGSIAQRQLTNLEDDRARAKRKA